MLRSVANVLAIGCALATAGLSVGVLGSRTHAATRSAAGRVARVAEPLVGQPRTIAALGDSFNTGFAARPHSGDNPELSWSIGDDPAVGSMLRRLETLRPRLTIEGALVAKDGSKIADLPRQVARAADAGSDLLTIQSGGNDICAATTAEGITPVDDFRQSVVDAFALLRERLPNARILVTSLTDEARWNDGSVDVAGNVDQLADGTVCDPQVDSNGRQSRARRARIQAWERSFNAVLRGVCATDLHCRYDGGAFFRLAYTARDVAPTDAFHPSVHGLARFAAAAWRAGFDFTDQTAPVVSATRRRTDQGLQVALAASDAAGAGIEYRIGGSSFATYTGPISLGSGERVVYRAVDRNGNISAAYAISAP